MSKTAHGTLTANTASVSTIDAGYGVLTITNRSQTGELWFTIDGSAPAAGTAGSFVCMGTRSINAPNQWAATTVTLISTGALKYSIEGEPS